MKIVNLTPPLATVNSDGSGLRQLNPKDEEPVGDRPYLGQPAYSPDGRLVAYLAYHDGAHASLCVIGSDGANPRTVGLADYGTLYWLQDRIVFARDNRFWTVRPDGSDAAPVDNGQPGRGNHSALSPDGKRLASIGGDAGDKLTLSDPDGGNARTLVTQPMSGHLVWSPDSQWIAYDVFGGFMLCIANRAGTEDWAADEEQISADLLRWSPDGRFLIYSAVPTGSFAVCYSSVRVAEPMARAKADVASGELIDWAPRARKMLVARCGEPAFDSEGNPQVETWLLTTLEGNDLETDT
jgi:Tol biopolymer transport system component